MPELPDVEIYKKYFEATALNEKIRNVQLISQGVLEPTSYDPVSLVNCHFTWAFRYGKHLFASSSCKLVLAMHFGMTGFLYDFREKNPYATHTRALIEFQKGHALAFVDVRQLGRISVVESIEGYIKQRKLGPDALSIPFETFQKLFKNGGSVKSLLMDQHKLAGVGNLYADEILFQSRIHPESSLRHLHDKEIKLLYKMMKDVLTRSIKLHADPDKMPSTWLIPKRNVKENCPRCKEAIQKTTVIGRSTYFCPHCQELNLKSP